MPRSVPADSSRTWLDNYCQQDTDNYGNLQITGKKLTLNLAYIITLEQFKEYLRNLDLELIKAEKVLNYLVTLIAEYPNILVENPILIPLQRVDLKTRTLFLNRYMALCEDWLAHGGFSWSPSKEVNQPNIHDVIDSLKQRHSIWEK
jgi:hypothetical protein